jgi:chemotaxis regulatin CheY-phosphate phosphatase CheZ
MKTAVKTSVASKKPSPIKRTAAAKTKPAAKKNGRAAPALKAVRKPAARGNGHARKEPDTGHVLIELKALAKELNKAAKDIGKRAGGGNPKEVSAILGNVERMTAEAANKSLMEAENAKQLVTEARDSLGKSWSRQQLEEALRGVDGHLTNIIVAQEFQDLAGQALRKAMKALVGAIIVVEAGGPTEDQRLSQKDVDALIRELMP